MIDEINKQLPTPCPWSLTRGAVHTGHDQRFKTYKPGDKIVVEIDPTCRMSGNEVMRLLQLLGHDVQQKT